ncbi:hypothetical protein T492DRAFT_163219 [Pavlovales sp. CCMP2436]|nr:hypothetical protein T492DRAFT_163219 [Pavlovales sp. CCMP2436]
MASFFPSLVVERPSLNRTGVLVIILIYAALLAMQMRALRRLQLRILLIGGFLPAVCQVQVKLILALRRRLLRPLAAASARTTPTPTTRTSPTASSAGCWSRRERAEPCSSRPRRMLSACRDGRWRRCCDSMSRWSGTGRPRASSRPFSAGCCRRRSRREF